MLRFASFSVVCLFASAVAQAGQISIGSNINSSTGLSANGLTTAYVTGTNTCAGAQLNPGTICATGSVTGFAEKGYSTALFSGVIDGPVGGPYTPPSPYSGYSATYNSGTNSITLGSTSPGKTITDPNNVTFSMLNDSANPTYNFWDSNTVGTDTMVIPIGLSGISEVWTMLNDLYGSTSGGPYISVTFNFATTANGLNANSTSSSVATVVVPLVEGSSIAGAVDCTGPATAPAGSGTCPAGMATSLNTSPQNLTNGSGETGDSAGLTLTATQATPTLAYTGTDSAGAGYQNTSGSVYLDDQAFNFGTTYLSDYLVSVQVTETSGATGVSRAALTDITVNQVSATPEPSTVFLVAGGLMMFAIFKSRRMLSRFRA